MEEKRDYSLLRPFDLEAAKRGEAICWCDDGQKASYLAGPDISGRIAIEWTENGTAVSKGQLGLICASYFSMAPLAWVEGKPVYKGDVLFHKPYGKVIVSGLGDYQKPSFTGEGEGNIGFHISSMTWNPTKKKREGWLNIYPLKCTWNAEWYETKNDADTDAYENRLDCIRIEWEE